jgi:hypothetical protein
MNNSDTTPMQTNDAPSLSSTPSAQEEILQSQADMLRPKEENKVAVIDAQPVAINSLAGQPRKSRRRGRSLLFPNFSAT